MDKDIEERFNKLEFDLKYHINLLKIVNERLDQFHDAIVHLEEFGSNVSDYLELIRTAHNGLDGVVTKDYKIMIDDIYRRVRRLEDNLE